MLPQPSRRALAKALASWQSKLVFSSCLVFALFGGGLWQLINFQDDPWNVVLDVLMTIVFVLFCIEVLLNVIADRRYFGSFFFFMDLLGSISMIFEISYILGPAGKMNTNETTIDPVFMRTARVAKSAARAGRFLKLTKCLEVIIRPTSRTPESADTAKRLSAKLMLALSTKVSLLTIVLVIAIPLFQIGQYPEEDLSMKVWGQRLEDSYAASYMELQADSTKTTSTVFAAVVEEMQSFYSAINYYPFKIEGYPEEVVIDGRVVTIPGQDLLDGEEPLRLQNVEKIEVSECKVPRNLCEGDDRAGMFINFEDAKRREDSVDMLMSLIVVLIMVALTSNLSSTIDKLVVKPLERILLMVREVTSTILKLTEEDNKDDEADDNQDETVLLERVFQKLSRITSIALTEDVVDTAGMSDEAKGVVVDMMNLRAKSSFIQGAVGRLRSVTSHKQQPERQTVAANLPCDPSEIDGWNLDIMSMDAQSREQVVLHIIFDTEIGASTGSVYSKMDTFKPFFDAVIAAYQDVYYHNSAHAVDIMHCVYRLLNLTQARHWIGDVDLYAVLVAALAHDMGHPGRTNPFLVETGHELALLYNDASPLENMHCASLFRVLKKEQTNVFKQLTKEQYKTARKVCVGTILHTDNANHFVMVKDVNKAYEVNSEIVEKQASLGEGADLTPLYEHDVLRKDSQMFLELFLHFADISNPLKPWPVSQAWTKRVLQEFFAQGDEEKRLGIPVGMLNDREKVSAAGSQHGFINFLVAPLVFSTVKILPCLHPLAQALAENIKGWRDVWVKEMNPEQEARQKRDADVEKIAATADELRRRVQPPPPPSVGGTRLSILGGNRRHSVSQQGNRQPFQAN